MSLSKSKRAKGIISASTGNHALGVARALEITQTEGIIYLPKNASKTKIAALSHYGVELQFYGKDSLETELYAKQIAIETDKIWVSPYNDLHIIAGQGTIGLELFRQIDSFDDVFVTVGGGGLISGVGCYLKYHRPASRLVGCQPANSPEMQLSVAKGEIVHLAKSKPTLSDGSAGGLEEDALTFPICQEIVDEFYTVTEEEIAFAIGFMAEHHKKIIEGAAAVTLACLFKNKHLLEGRKIVLIICGANIDRAVLKSVL